MQLFLVNVFWLLCGCGWVHVVLPFGFFCTLMPPTQVREQILDLFLLASQWFFGGNEALTGVCSSDKVVKKNCIYCRGASTQSLTLNCIYCRGASPESWTLNCIYCRGASPQSWTLNCINCIAEQSPSKVKGGMRIAFTDVQENTKVSKKRTSKCNSILITAMAKRRGAVNAAQADRVIAGLGGLAALDGAGWETSTTRLRRRIVIRRHARYYTIARYFCLCAILRQTLSPKP